jgi:type IV pilus assembly protein PilY1
MSRRLLIATLTAIGLSIALPAAAGTLTQTPLTLVNRVPSNVLFSLSVEFPTANTAAYQDSNGYTASNTYRGLFDSEKCYDYSAADGRFNPVSLASSHACTGHWSGNFLNWATMTGLDEFRYAMTGGNRVVDTASLTVLQRSYQSGQGGTSNFPNKTFSGSGATAYSSSSNLTISNQGQGTQMTVSTSGSLDVADCANPSLSGSTFSCAITTQTTNETGSCTTWTGSGTSTSPYLCSSFGAFPSSGTPTSTSPGTTGTASSGTATNTVTCSNPTYGSAFNCTLTNAASASGSCTTWAGKGTSASPFSCSTFGTFGGSTFAPSSQAAATSFTTGGSTTAAVDSTSCSYSQHKITCKTQISQQNISCTTGTTTGTNTDPFACSSSSTWTLAGNVITVTSFDTSTGYSGGKNNRYMPITSITYNTPSQTYYYIPSYSGSNTGLYYYYSTYNLTFGGSTVYNVNVEVCNASIGLESNCILYGNGTTYKPVGELQRNGDQMRFGVFSYYNANDVDNAVMRSKAKYVAPTKWTASGPVSNSNMEWSATDGTLVTNPDATEATNSYGGAVSNSGVINYINKFGLTSHSYKTYDNVGKLYYETLKYLRGLQPTTAFYSKATTGNGDGFPIITTWDDPVQYSCQKNFIITMGDTHTWCDKRLPGGLFTSGGSCGPYNSQTADFGSLGGDTGVDVGLWTNKLGTFEGNSNLATTGTENSASFYMSGLAYWAAYNGFRTVSGKAMKAKTYVIDVQEYADLGKNTQYWFATKYGGADKFNSDGSPYDSTTTDTQFNWWTNSPQTTGKWPKTLLPAGNPDLMINAVKSAFGSIAAQNATASAAALSSGTLNTNTGLYVYQSSYNSSNWSGDVSAYHIDNTNLTQNTSPTWKASDFLTPSILNPSSGTQPWLTRRIITFNDGLNVNGTDSTATNGRRGVEFQASTSSSANNFTSNFSPRQQALLSLDPGTMPTDTGPDRVDYLRGDSSNEGTNGQQWRVRTSSLGDFVNSSAVYVRRPSATEIPYADQSTFNSYVTAVASRTPVVYAGSNDGMLHVFNASDASDDGTSAAAKTADSGKEMLAYVPAAVYPNLKNLTTPNYIHNYFVDNTPVIADAQLSSAACTPSSDATKCWRTVITGGLGGGGQGIYALNGTDPSTFGTASAASLVFWEFTDQDDADLGNTFGQPLVRKMNNGKWAVIFGNGYNNTTADGKASSDGRAYLYILMLDGPGPFSSARGNQWTLGTDYFKIKLTAPNEGSTTPLSPANGLSTVYGVDKNGDNLVDYLYAGDRYGNLWKIDVSSSNPASWGSAFGSSTTPLPLFTAVTADSTPKRQQITTSPFVQPNPNGGFMVMFGTGSFVDISDNVGPFDTDSFYGIWDKDDGTQVTGRSQLQRQASLAYDSSTGYGIVSNCSVQYSATAAVPSAATTFCPSSLAPSLDSDGNVAQQLGWVLDLNFQLSSSNTGERYISSPLPILNSGLLSFRTITPSNDPCGGAFTDFDYNVNYLTGGQYQQPVYYGFSASTPAPISISFTIGGVTVSDVHPSGKTVVSPGTTNAQPGSGQNQKPFTVVGPNPYSPTTGCAMVAGRPCRNPHWQCTPNGTPTPACIKAPATGRVSWRQIMQ